MAVYKVIQNVEAEDKLLGPLTFKAFIYAIIAAVCAYISFRLLMLGTPIKWLLLPLLVFPTLLFGVLASPLGRDQPTEVWLLSKIKFFLKPKLRLWDQSGLEELVTISVPKKVEQQLSDNLSQPEVRSRLKTLASTLDTRGWAIKNVDLNLNTVLPQTKGVAAGSDRLVANAGYTQTASVIDVHPADDIMDEQNNPTAQKFAAMMQAEDQKRKQNVRQTMKGLLDDSALDDTVLKAGEDRFAKAKEDFKKQHSKLKQKPANQPKPTATKVAPIVPKPTPVTPERQAVNMELAQSGSAFSVSTLSQLANRQPRVEQTAPGEVTISLH